MASGIFSNFIKHGEWTPKAYDDTTFLADFNYKGKYWKIGKLVIACLPTIYAIVDMFNADLTVNTIFTIANLPMNVCVSASNFYFNTVVDGATVSVQGNAKAAVVDVNHAHAYFRPNITGTIPKNIIIRGYFIGYDN